MNNVLTTIAALLVLVLALLFTVPMMINWDNYRSDFEVHLSKLVGSKVELDGSLNLRLLPAPFVSAENLRIGESGVRGRPILEVKELTMWVSVPPLLKGIMEASKLTLDRPRLLLQFDKKGQPTFEAEPQTTKLKNAANRKLESGSGQDELFSQEASISGFKLSPNLISLKNVQIIDGDVALQSAPRGKDKRARSFAVARINGSLSAVTLKGPFYFNGKYTEGADERFVRLAIGTNSDETTNEKENETARYASSLYPIKMKISDPLTDSRVEFEGEVGEKGKKWFASGGVKAGFGIYRAGADVTASLKKSGKEPADKLAEDKKVVEQNRPAVLSKGAGVTRDEDFYITSHLELTALNANFTKILVRAGSLARPQTVRGKVVIDWRDELSLKGDAVGQVIDLNSIFARSPFNPVVVDSQMRGVKNAAPARVISPAVAVSKLNDILASQAQQFEEINFSLKANQIFLGKGDVRDFQLLINGDKDGIRIEDLAGRLPGSSRLNVNGLFEAGEVQSSFRGQVYLRGLQFKEFIQWAMPEYVGDLGFGRGKFMLNGVLDSDDNQLQLSGLQGDIGRSSLRGGLLFNKGDGKNSASEIRLLLKAGEINVEELLGKPVGLLEFEEALAAFIKRINGRETEASGTATAPLADNQPKTAALKSLFELTAQRLVFKDGVQRDVRLLWLQDKDGSRIKSVEGVSENGLKFLYENGKADPSGEDRFLIEAPDFVAVEDLLKLSGVENSLQFEGDAVGRFFPLRLAVRRQDEDDATQYRFDGVMGGSDTAFSVFVPKVANGVDQGPMTVLGGMESQNGAILAAKLLPLGFERQVQDKDLGPASLTFTASGTSETGFKGQVNLDNEVMSATYQGRFSLKQQQLASDGVLEFKGDNSREVLGLFGYAHLAAEADAPIKARGNISLTNNGYSLSDLQMVIGEHQVVGTGLFEEKDGEKRYRLAMATDRLDFGSLLGALQSDKAQKSKSQSGKGELWSAVPFDFSLDAKGRDAKDLDEKGRAVKSRAGKGLSDRKSVSSNELYSSREPLSSSERLFGVFSIKANELQLTEQLSLSDALVQWRVHKTHIEILRLEGKSLGGTFVASGTLRQGNGAYSLSGKASLKGARLEEVGAAEEASVGAGAFSLELSLSGVGSSPKELVASLVGQGFVKITDGELRQVRPSLLGQLAERYLRSETGDPVQLKSDIETIVSNAAPIPLNNIDLGLQLIDGRLKLRQDDLGVKPGSIGVRAELKLTDLHWSGDWFIQPARQAKSEAIPVVVRRLKGDLTSNSGVVSKLDVAEFERFLTLKHKERELRQLEKIRLEDESRRLAEQRRQAEEELKRINKEKARIKAEQEALDKELNRTDLPLLQAQ